MECANGKQGGGGIAGNDQILFAPLNYLCICCDSAMDESQL